MTRQHLEAERHHEQRAIIDQSDPHANTYGCMPCPRCNSIYRAAYPKSSNRPLGPTVECDRCGLIELAVFAEESST
jgi:hypothetical protein